LYEKQLKYEKSKFLILTEYTDLILIVNKIFRSFEKKLDLLINKLLKKFIINKYNKKEKKIFKIFYEKVNLKDLVYLFFLYLIIVNKFTDTYIEIIDLIDFYEFLFKNYNELLNKNNLNNDEKIIIKFIEYLKKFNYVKKLKNLLVLDIEKIKNNNILLEFIYILLFLLINSLKFNKFINLKIIENNQIMIKYLKLFKNKIKNLSHYKLIQNLSLMKVKPFIWNKDGLNGGFLFYKSSLQIYKSLNINNKFKFNDFYINIINKLSSQKFLIDFNLLELIKKYKFIFFGDLKYLINEKNNVIKELIDFFNQKYLIKNKILLKKIRKNLAILLKELDLNILLNEYNLLLKYYKKIKYEFKNNLNLVLLFLKLKTYFEKFVKIVVFDRIYNELNLEFKNVIVYLPHRIDYRGRIYNINFFLNIFNFFKYFNIFIWF